VPQRANRGSTRRWPNRLRVALNLTRADGSVVNYFEKSGRRTGYQNYQMH